MGEKILFIDNREKSGLEDLVKKYLDKNKLRYQTRQNMITDYAFNSVGIEAKSVDDYMGSMYSGHLERQLQNLDDNYANPYLLIWGTLDGYVAKAKKGGRKIQFPKAWSSYIGSLARFTTDFDISVIMFPDRSSAARWICKRFEKDGSLGSSSTYRVLRKTRSEDMRIDVLRGAGCSDAIAERLIETHGSIAEITALSIKELTQIEGVGKIRAERIIKCLHSETPVESESVRMSRA